VKVAVHWSSCPDAVQLVEEAPTTVMLPGPTAAVPTFLRVKYSFPLPLSYVGVPTTTSMGLLVTLLVALITNHTTSPAAATSPMVSNAAVILNAPLRLKALSRRGFPHDF